MTTLALKYALAAALLLAPAAAIAQAGADAAADSPANIYDKQLGPGWQNWSWATTELSVDAGAYKPIKVEAKGWQALYLHHDPFDTTPWRGITLMMQCPGGETQFRVVAIVGGKPVIDPATAKDAEPQPLAHLVKANAAGWNKVQISFHDLGIEKKQIDGFWIQNASGNDAPPVFVAAISLVK